MKANEFMSTNVITCKTDCTVEQAAKTMIEKEISVIPVVDDQNRLKGIITESDFVGKKMSIPHALASIKRLFGTSYYFGEIEPIYKSAKILPLSKVMTSDVKTIGPETELTEVVDLMLSRQLKRLPVLENDKVVGIITRKDLLKAFINLN